MEVLQTYVFGTQVFSHLINFWKLLFFFFEFKPLTPKKLTMFFIALTR